MQRTISQIHQWLARIFLAGLLLQFYLAGAGLFGLASFEPHRMLGDALSILAIFFPVLAVVGRLGSKLIGFSTLLLFLTVVQIVLPSLRVDASWIAAFHPVNAVALMGLSATIRRYSRAAAIH